MVAAILMFLHFINLSQKENCKNKNSNLNWSIRNISFIFRNIWWVVCWSPSLVNISKARRVNEELLLIHLILISNYINRLLHILVCFFRLFELYIPSFVSPLPEVWTASNIIPTLEECFMANVFFGFMNGYM